MRLLCRFGLHRPFPGVVRDHEECATCRYCGVVLVRVVALRAVSRWRRM